MSSGFLLALCLPRPGFCFLAWFALAPLFRAWSRSRPRQAAGLGFAAGFCFHGLALHWIYSTCRFALIPIPLAILAWGALAAFLALHWALVGGVGTWALKPIPEWLKPWAWAVVWIALSAAWERWTPRLSVDLLAYTQYRNLNLLQIGSILGPFGLGLLIVACNAVLAQVWEGLESRRQDPFLARNAAAAAFLFLLAWGYGTIVLAWRFLEPRESLPRARVEILQPAVDQYHKWDEAWAGAIEANFRELLDGARADKPDLVVWPESALPRWVREGTPIREAGSPALQAFQLVGAVSRSAEGESHNSAFLLGPNGAVRGIYHKRQLVPFGEFLPFPFLKKFVGLLQQMGDLSPGNLDQELLPTPLGPAAATICYEAMFPTLSRRDAARGARLIVNLTNDGWYKDTWGPYQHFYANIFRAIENRVPVIRVGNTGISAVIDPWGVVLARLDLNRRGRLDVEMATGSFPEGSFYSRHGDLLGTFCLWGLAGLALLRLRRA
ncbi:MAG: apolipoprotein N-acyltransferase [Elusimicrobia bacterium]|nr:apolipoprotein N-acyltransferase [Elusimicrobiota bacterium]